MIVIMAGLPATGKSTLARALANCVRGAVLDKDILRATLFAPEDIEYTAVQDDFVMELMLQTAQFLFNKDPDRVVFLDGRTFSYSYQRQRVLDFAETLGTTWRIIECVCADEIATGRLADDERTGRHLAANRTVHLYESVRSIFEPIPQPKIVIDTAEPLEACVRVGLAIMANTRDR